MTSEERDEVLENLRAYLCSDLRDRLDEYRSWGVGLRSDSRACVRIAIEYIRALDDVREQARDRAFMADLWMYMACGLSREDAAKRARAEHGYDKPVAREVSRGE